MPSITDAADLAELAKRLRIVAEALKRVPADNAFSAEERAALCKEVKAVAIQLRRIN